MILSRRFQAVILLLGDLILFYIALVLTLVIRYSSNLAVIGSGQLIDLNFAQIWSLHKWPFFFVHIIWVLIFYISDLYDIRKFSSPKMAMAKVLKTMAIAGPMAALLFYLVPFFGITPKTNLFIDVVLAALFLMLWRRYFWMFSGKASKIKVLFFGSSKETESFADYLKRNAQLGYEPAVILAEVGHNLVDLIQKNKIQLIVASKNILEDKSAVKRFYEALPLGISILDFPDFYETVAEKIPVSVISESWFLVNLVEINKRLFESFKRVFDIALSIILGVPTMFLFPIIGAVIKISGDGSIFYRQKRVGKNGKIFEIVKFRTMEENAEKNGAQWAIANDPRATKAGKILRKTRLDELPQLWNILRGDMSFIGPRPERPEFIAELQKQIPHYAMRHLIKPGLTGWAQIKFPYAASVEDAMEKLQYDLYYIKNRSSVLDLAIFARTIAIVISRKGH